MNNKASFNRPQLISIVNNARREVDISGRASGKTTKRAWRWHKLITSMPRSANAMVGRSFMQLLTNTLSPLLEGLDRLGYERDKHYFIGRKPPAKWNWPTPYQAPVNYDKFICFYTGAGFHLMSQDRQGRNRGFNIDSWDADEGFLLDKNRLENEVMMANRGNIHRFRDNPLHHSFSITSSMPPTAEGAWLLEYGKYYDEDGNDYWRLWSKVVRLQMEFLEEKNHQARMEYMRQWIQIIKQIRFYKKDGTLFLFSNAFDNLQNLGLNYIQDQKKIMTPLSFRIEMLNEKLQSVDDCFYKIREDQIYEAFNYSTIDNLNYDFKQIKHTDCRYDSDVDLHRPLDIGLDYGAAINSMRVCQEHFYDMHGRPSWEYRYLKSLFVLWPKGLKELIYAFCDYYEPHAIKEVDYWYDQTAIGRDPERAKFNELVVKYFQERRWKVRLHYVGAAPDHIDKYLLWEILCRGEDKRLPKVKFNRYNDKEGLLSMQLAGVREGRKGIEKDKSVEKSKLIPREQATDLSDAGDILVWGRYHKKISMQRAFIDIIT